MSFQLIFFLIFCQIIGILCECCYKDGESGRCLDRTGPTPYCGYGKCNRFGCNCMGGCRSPRTETECCHIGTPGLDGYCIDIANVTSGHCLTSECERNICSCSSGLCRLKVKTQWEAQLFEEKHYKKELGLVWSDDLSFCMELNSGSFESGKTSSIIALENCVILFSKPGCGGEPLMISHNHEDLESVHFNKMPRSISSCEKELDCCKPNKGGLCRDRLPPKNGHCGHGACDNNGCNCIGGGCRPTTSFIWTANLFGVKHFRDELGLVGGAFDSTCVVLNSGHFKDEHVSSINTLNNCVFLYTNLDCTGKKVGIFPGSFYHGDLGSFDKKARSISSCEYSEITTNKNYKFENVDTNDDTTTNVYRKNGAFDPLEIYLYLFIPSVLIFSTIGIVILAYIIWDRMFYGKLKKFSKKTKEIELIGNINLNLNLYGDYEGLTILRSELDFEGVKYLDSGNFGQILLIKYEEKQVVLKRAKDLNNTLQSDTLRKELYILSKLGRHCHPNIIQFIGACFEKIDDRPLHIVVEYCKLGGLEAYLKRHKQSFKNLYDKKFIRYEALVDTNDLIRWSFQIASGMVYLEKSNIIHGDLAARNVLLCSKKCAKITDFGLSKKLYKYMDGRIYRQINDKPLPLAWLAEETLFDQIFSTQTDVWAFGVTLWEIFSLCETPYGKLSYELSCDVFRDKIKNNLRLDKPDYSNTIIFNEMKKCWTTDPEERPKFTRLENFFLELIPTT